MAYKEGHNPTEDVIRRNQEAIILNGISCCTCGYCVKRQVQPTVTFKNFRPIPAQAISPESGYQEYIYPTIAASEFTYDLDYKEFNATYVNPYLTISQIASENWNSPEQLNKKKLAQALTYYNFRNCSGSPTSFQITNNFYNNYSPYNNQIVSFYSTTRYYYFYDYLDKWDVNDTDCGSPNTAPYNSLFLLANDYYNHSGFPYYFNFHCSNPIIYPYLYYNYPYYINLPFNSNKSYVNFLSLSTCGNVEQSTNGWYSTIPNGCTASQIIEHLGASALTPAPKPSNPFDIGDYQSLFDYIDANDFSLNMIKTDNTCENNMVKVIDLFQRQDKSSYSFPFIYPEYNFVSSSVSNTPAITFPRIDSNSIAKSGYVLSRFDLSFANRILTCEFAMSPLVDFYATLSNCNNNPYYVVSDNAYVELGQNSGVYCSVNSNFWQFNPDSLATETVYSKTFYSLRTNYYYNYNNYYYGNYASVDTSFFDYNNENQSSYAGFYGNVSVVNNYYYNYQYNYLPSYSCNQYFNLNSTIETDSSGESTLKLSDVKFFGGTYLATTYVNKDGNNRKILAGVNKVPLNYTATLSMGFMCDIEINFQSVPLCQIKDVPDKFKRVEELKVTFSDYRKTPQNQTFYRDYLNYIKEQSPRDIGFNYIEKNLFFTNYYYYLNYSNYLVDSAENMIFSPPDVNQENPFYLKRGSIIKSYSPILNPVKKNFTCQINPNSNYKSSGKFYGRVYSESENPDEFKSSFLVNGDSSIWETGNRISFSNSITSNSDFTHYCIFVRTISDNSQNAGQTLIRIASTYQEAIDGVNIAFNAFYYATYKKITVEYNSYFEEDSLNNAPSYSSFKSQDYYIDNPNLDKFGISYTNNLFPVSISSLVLRSQWNGTDQFDFQFVDKSKLPSIYFYFYKKSFDSIEVISLSPLIIKIWGAIFSNTLNYYYNYSTHYDYTYQSVFPNFAGESPPMINGYSFLSFGFTCDITIEEHTNEFTQNSLPTDFNGLLTMQSPINTTDPSYKMPLRIIPERCEHIGKVTDRKNCNCPQKWIRDCDIHGSTDWKNCMSCKDYKED